MVDLYVCMYMLMDVYISTLFFNPDRQIVTAEF